MHGQAGSSVIVFHLLHQLFLNSLQLSVSFCTAFMDSLCSPLLGVMSKIVLSQLYVMNLAVTNHGKLYELGLTNTQVVN